MKNVPTTIAGCFTFVSAISLLLGSNPNGALTFALFGFLFLAISVWGK